MLEVIAATFGAVSPYLGVIGLVVGFVRARVSDRARKRERVLSDQKIDQLQARLDRIPDEVREALQELSGPVEIDIQRDATGRVTAVSASTKRSTSVTVLPEQLVLNDPALKAAAKRQLAEKATANDHT